MSMEEEQPEDIPPKKKSRKKKERDPLKEEEARLLWKTILGIGGIDVKTLSHETTMMAMVHARWALDKHSLEDLLGCYHHLLWETPWWKTHPPSVKKIQDLTAAWIARERPVAGKSEKNDYPRSSQGERDARRQTTGSQGENVDQESVWPEYPSTPER